MQNAMWVSRSTPSSAAPCTMSSRWTARANALSFIFLRTLRDFDLGNGFAWLDQGAGGEKAGQLVAGEESLGKVRRARHARVLRVTKNGGAKFLRPAQPLQLANTGERVLLGGGMALVVEVVEQGGGGIQLQQRRPRIALEPEPVCLLLAAGHNTGFHGERMFAQAFALGPFGEQLPGLFASDSSGWRRPFFSPVDQTGS